MAKIREFKNQFAPIIENKVRNINIPKVGHFSGMDGDLQIDVWNLKVLYSNLNIANMIIKPSSQTGLNLNINNMVIGASLRVTGYI